MTLYLDSSAVVKLVLVERESRALRGLLREDPSKPATSTLSRAEVVRAVTSVDTEHVPHARMILDGMEEVVLTRTVIDRAAEVLPEARLRTLDAIHLASALRLGPRLTSVVTYDQRMAAAATELGLAVAAPS